jgi:hypothetical protein
MVEQVIVLVFWKTVAKRSQYDVDYWGVYVDVRRPDPPRHAKRMPFYGRFGRTAVSPAPTFRDGLHTSNINA